MEEIEEMINALPSGRKWSTVPSTGPARVVQYTNLRHWSTGGCLVSISAVSPSIFLNICMKPKCLLYHNKTRLP